MIEISHLTKRFGAFVAVNDLSLKLQPGEILGFLGPNGAGKSTTMKMLTGYLVPTSGSISINGIDVVAQPTKAQALIGYLPEGAPCYEEMTPLGFLDFIASIRGLSGGEKNTAIHRVVEQMSLQQVLGQRIETLSKGFKRRVGLAQAMIHDPDILILDEPTDGLDPNQKHQVRELIQGLSEEKIVVISTHILEEVEAVCNRAVIIANGQMKKDCTPSELLAMSRHAGAIHIEFEAGSNLQDLDRALGSLEAVLDTELVTDGLWLFPRDGVHLYQQVNDNLAELGIKPVSLYQDRGRLDEVFREITLSEDQGREV